MRNFGTLALLIALSSLTGCWRSKQQLYTNVENHSGKTLNALEIDYPGASYGISQLKSGETNRKWVAVTPPCTYSVHFEDEKGKAYQSKPIEFGKDKCPAEVVLTIDSQMNVTGAPK